MMSHGQMPDPSQKKPESKDMILHARIELGGTALMGADVDLDRV
jgi:uncharacterized glyoxalase superfamily protein PhnB